MVTFVRSSETPSWRMFSHVQFLWPGKMNTIAPGLDAVYLISFLLKSQTHWLALWDKAWGSSWATCSQAPQLSPRLPSLPQAPQPQAVYQKHPHNSLLRLTLECFLQVKGTLPHSVASLPVWFLDGVSIVHLFPTKQGCMSSSLSGCVKVPLTRWRRKQVLSLP